MDTQTIKVIAAVLDRSELKMWVDDGSAITIPQGDPRLKGLVDTLIPELRANNFAWINMEKLTTPNVFSDYEEKTNGLVRFFKVAKSKIASLFGSREEPKQVEPAWCEPILIGNPFLTVKSIEHNDQAVIDEIMANAIPADSSAFKAADVVKGTSTDTIVAVTQEGIVPGAEMLAHQLQHAVKTGATKGVEAFLKRMAAIAKERNHTAQELLKFLEEGDLPLTDGGDIVIYKRLYSEDGGWFTDPHTRRVRQSVGSLVRMDPKLVDPSRAVECSQGLHVGRRRYMGNFHGDAILLGIVKPEDVIAVPYSEPDKMRVCAYHLLGRLDAESFQAICRNEPFPKGSNGQTLLAMALSGSYPPHHSITQIGGPSGTNVTITPAVQPAGMQTTPNKANKVAEAIDLNATVAEPPKAPSVDPKDVVKAVEATAKSSATPTRAQQAKTLFKAFQNAKKADKPTRAQELLDYKKKTKIGWGALGIEEAQEAIEPYLKK